MKTTGEILISLAIVAAICLFTVGVSYLLEDVDKHEFGDEVVVNQRTWVYQDGNYLYPIDSVWNGDTLIIYYH